jgi:hypothetical protein
MKNKIKVDVSDLLLNIKDLHDAMIFFLIKNQTMKIKNIGRLNKIYYLN